MKYVAYGFNKNIKQYNTPSLHAEIDAYYKLKNKREKYNLLVLRFSKGELTSSRPCYNCLKTLLNSGINIQYVYYSNKGEIMKEKFTDMLENEKTCVSSGMRKFIRER